MILKKHRRKVFVILFAVLASVSVAAAALLCVSRAGVLRAQNISELMSARNEPPGDTISGPEFYETVATPHFTCLLSTSGGVSLFSGYNFLSDKADLAQIVQAALTGGAETAVLEQYDLRFSISSYSEDSRLLSFVDTSAMQKQLSRYVLAVTAALLPVLALAALLCRYLSALLVRPVRDMIDEQHRFIAGASHELKSPLAIISSNAQLLGSCPDGEKAALWSNNIQQECRRMSDLVQGLTAVTLSAMDRPQTKERVDFSDLLEGELTRFEVLAYEKGLAFSSEAQAELFVTGDAQQLSRLVDILMDNAIRYCRPGGTVDVRLVRSGAAARLSVFSSGEPLTPEQCENVFIPFYRVGQGKGFGLGLSIAWEIVSSMNGSLRAMAGRDGNTFVAELGCEAAR